MVKKQSEVDGGSGDKRIKRRRKRGRSFSLNRSTRRNSVSHSSETETEKNPACAKVHSNIPLGLYVKLQPQSTDVETEVKDEENIQGGGDNEAKQGPRIELVDISEEFFNLEADIAEQPFKSESKTSLYFVPVMPIQLLGKTEVRTHLQKLEIVLERGLRNRASSTPGLIYVYILAELLNLIFKGIAKADLSYEKWKHAIFCFHRLMLHICDLWVDAKYQIMTDLSLFVMYEDYRMETCKSFQDMGLYSVFKLIIPETCLPWKLFVKMLLHAYFVQSASNYCRHNSLLNVEFGNFSKHISDGQRQLLLFQFMSTQLKAFCFVSHLCEKYGAANQSDIYDLRNSEPTPMQLEQTTSHFTNVLLRLSSWKQLHRFIVSSDGCETSQEMKLILGGQINANFFKGHVILSALYDLHKPLKTTHWQLASLANKFNIPNCTTVVQMNKALFQVKKMEVDKVKLEYQQAKLEALVADARENEPANLSMFGDNKDFETKSHTSWDADGTSASEYDPMQEEEELYRRINKMHEKRGFCLWLTDLKGSLFRRSQRFEKGIRKAVTGSKSRQNIGNDSDNVKSLYESCVERLRVVEIENTFVTSELELLKSENESLRNRLKAFQLAEGNPDSPRNSQNETIDTETAPIRQNNNSENFERQGDNDKIKFEAETEW
eukprot:CAMPEP_0184018622 /NCGR_PEP_ID=MMETSP0954-20121128/8252_1 /TAXON_ID=627963 /ORGANISM="Aplanochytrium sp, Strain PBS07" /LENGTH=662 /DNA_ID=CAMNT_0026300105 /DNA_START=81 /DNA_END=2066 /DNA_ORIENTATION=+